MKNVREFWCIWFESTQLWIAVLDNQHQLGPFPAIGHVMNSVYRATDRGEVEFKCTYDDGRCYHYEADDKFYKQT